MSLLDHQQRMQSASLQSRAEEQRQIEACAQFLTQHLVHQSHPLARLFIRSGWSRIDQAFATQRLIHSSHLRTNTVGVLCLVFVKGRRTCQPFQELCSCNLHMCQLGGIRCHESSQQLGHHTYTWPLIEGQQSNVVVFFEYRLSTGFYFQRELRIDALGTLAQFVNVGQHLQVVHAHCLPHGDAIYDSLRCSNQFATDGQSQRTPVLGGVVGKFQILQAFAPVDGHSVVQAGKIFNLQTFSVDIVDHGFNCLVIIA